MFAFQLVPIFFVPVERTYFLTKYCVYGSSFVRITFPTVFKLEIDFFCRSLVHVFQMCIQLGYLICSFMKKIPAVERNHFWSNIVYRDFQDLLSGRLLDQQVSFWFLFSSRLIILIIYEK